MHLYIYVITITILAMLTMADSAYGREACTAYSDEEKQTHNYLVCTLESGEFDLSSLVEIHSCKKSGNCAHEGKDLGFGPYQALGTFRSAPRFLASPFPSFDIKPKTNEYICTVYFDSAYPKSLARFLVCLGQSGSVDLQSVVHYRYCEQIDSQTKCRRINESETYGSIGPFRALATMPIRFAHDLSKIFGKSPPILEQVESGEKKN